MSKEQHNVNVIFAAIILASLTLTVVMIYKTRLIETDNGTITTEARQETATVPSKAGLSSLPTDASFRNNSRRTGFSESKPIEQMTELKWQFASQGSEVQSVVAAAGTVFFAGRGQDSGRILTALDSENGLVKWQLEVGGTGQLNPGYVTSAPAISGGVVYIGTGSTMETPRFPRTPDEKPVMTDPDIVNGLAAIDAASGKLRWIFGLPKQIVDSSPVVVGSNVFFGTSEGILYALDPATGNEKWRFSAGGWIHSSPAVDKDVIYFGCGDPLKNQSIPGQVSGVFAIDANSGAQIWSFSTKEPVMETPSVEGGTLYVPADGNMLAIDAANGQLKWSFKIESSVSSAAVANDTVYFACRDENNFGAVIAVNATTGQEIWRSRMEELPGAPTLAGNMVYFGCGDGYFRALDAAKGEEKWKFKVFLGGLPEIAGGTIYLGDKSGNLYALR
ncbi:MAG: outer membrane protein assembly factor BamB family protein [Thermoleophilia bacterium]